MRGEFPRIGLTTYRERAAFGVWDETADVLHASYADAIHAAGGVPMLLPPTIVDADLEPAAEATLDGLHGLVLTGGADVDPDRYAAARDEHTGATRADRDSWEIELVGAALRRDLPLLGVCRGMQVLAVALGGTLVQHLPDIVGTDVHNPIIGVHARHGVRLADGSGVAAIVGPTAVVATHHHQAVGRLPERAIATGWADDGTLEAFDVCDATWALGVQWHPEVHDGQALFSALVDASVAYRDRMSVR
jgi:gamma-glutamyl-gamma-aminobutyrate hydrolase PuuD